MWFVDAQTPNLKSQIYLYTNNMFLTRVTVVFFLHAVQFSIFSNFIRTHLNNVP